MAQVVDANTILVLNNDAYPQYPDSCGMKNLLINGDLNVWQRGTSFSNPANGLLTADRWSVWQDGTPGTNTVSRNSLTPSTSASLYSLKWDISTLPSGQTFKRLEQRIENVRNLSGQSLFFSFQSLAPTGTLIDIDLVQNFGSGGSADVVTNLATGVSLTAGAYFTYRVAGVLPTVGGKTIGANSFTAIRISIPINVTLSIQFARMQLEKDQFTPFEVRPESLDYSMCQRHCQVIGMQVGTTATTVPFRSPMMDTPTATGGSVGFALANQSSSGATCSQTVASFRTITLSSEL
jgi:hypothetical protein